MKTNKTKWVYRIAVICTALWFGASGFFELTRNPVVWDKSIALGYPAYFITTLGIAKLSGVLALLLPDYKSLLWIKEWVFAGLFFDIVFALISGWVVFGTAEIIAPVIAFLIVLTAYVTFRKQAEEQTFRIIRSFP
ncbi:DoxX family protein [Sinomicrobium sp. M5D2P17]